jgi:hypothetical protein
MTRGDAQRIEEAKGTGGRSDGGKNASGGPGDRMRVYLANLVILKLSFLFGRCNGNSGSGDIRMSSQVSVAGCRTYGACHAKTALFRRRRLDIDDGAEPEVQ